MRNRVGHWGRIAAPLAALASLAACASAPTPAPVYRSSPSPVASLPTIPIPADAPFTEFNAPRVSYDGPHSECVPFARTASGVAIWGDAVTWWGQAEGKYPRSSSPAEGSVFVMRGYNDDKRGHVAVVSEVVNERMIRVDQANWLSSGEMSYGVPLMDVSADNSWTEVRMWYVPGGHWGGRTYRADGFIHPIPLGLMPIG